MTKGYEAAGTSTVGPALQAGSEKWAGIKGAVNHMIGAASRIPDVYTRNVETQKTVNEQLGTDGESSPMAGLDRRLRDLQVARQERRLARQTSPEANRNTVRKTLAVVGETIKAGLDRFGVGSVGEEYYAKHKTTERKISPAPPPTEEGYARDKAQREAETQQNQIPTSEQAPPAEQEQHTGEDAAIARVQAEVVALTDEKVQEINAAESATDAVFAKGMADIAVQSKIAHEVILPYSAEGIAQLETMRSDALATLQQALNARNQGARPAATPSQELAPSGAQAELAPAPVSTSEQAPQPTGFEAQVSELTDRTAQEIMASHSTMDAIRMKGEAASAVLSMAARELMQPHLSREDAAQLKDTRDRALAALQAALDVRLESPDSHQATSVATEGQPLAEAAQAPEATTTEPTHEEVDGSVEENRAAAIKAATEVEGEKKDRLIHRAQTALHMAQKAIWAVKDWFSQKVPDPKPTPNLPLKDHSFTKASNGEAQEQPVAVDTEAQATQPHTPSQERPVANTGDPFALAEAVGVVRGGNDLGEPVVTSHDEAAHRGEGEPEAELAEVINFPAGAEQPPANDEAPTKELETVAEAINTQEDAPLSRDEMRQMEQIARSKIQLGEYDLWAEMRKADLNGVEVDIDGLIKNTRTAIQQNVRGWLQEEGRQHQASGLYLSTLEARTMESADSALESIKQAYLKAKQARESRQDSAA